jgi:hypothetical protein
MSGVAAARPCLLETDSIRSATPLRATAPTFDELPLIVWAARANVAVSPAARLAFSSAMRFGVSSM